MAMFASKSKFRKFIDSWSTVWKLRGAYDAQSCGFQCVDRIKLPESTDDVQVPEPGKAIFIGDGVAECVCSLYSKNEACMNTACEKHRWNTTYVDLANQLQEAKEKRKQAFRDMFRIREK